LKSTIDDLDFTLLNFFKYFIIAPIKENENIKDIKLSQGINDKLYSKKPEFVLVSSREFKNKKYSKFSNYF
jgi:hypothetical protein